MSMNVFVIGLEEFNLRQLRTIRDADEYNFHGLVSYGEIVDPEHYPIEAMLDEARLRLKGFGGSVDAIIGHWDFPTTCLLPLLRQPFGLPGPSLESVLKCDNKYWTRLVARESIPEATPPFQVVDPFSHTVLDDIGLPYPYWLKPVTAFSSYLAFRVRNRADLSHAIGKLRAGIDKFAKPYNTICRLGGMHGLPGELQGRMCVAEGPITGHQCTVEGYVQAGRVECYAFVDSFRERNRSSFSRYQMPSILPLPVQERMRVLTVRLISHLGLDDTPFNVEFFWQRGSGHIQLLEVNPRLSKSHCHLFTLTRGASHHQVAVDVALTRKPEFPRRPGLYRHAAKFMPRTFEDARVVHVPDAATVNRVERTFPGAEVHVHVRPGMLLSELPNQDSFSYELADIFLGADSRPDLGHRFRRVMEMLDIRLAPVESTTDRAVSTARG